MGLELEWDLGQDLRLDLFQNLGLDLGQYLFETWVRNWARTWCKILVKKLFKTWVWIWYRTWFRTWVWDLGKDLGKDLVKNFWFRGGRCLYSHLVKLKILNFIWKWRRDITSNNFGLELSISEITLKIAEVSVRDPRVRRSNFNDLELSFIPFFMCTERNTHCITTVNHIHPFCGNIIILSTQVYAGHRNEGCSYRYVQKNSNWWQYIYHKLIDQPPGWFLNVFSILCDEFENGLQNWHPTWESTSIVKTLQACKVTCVPYIIDTVAANRRIYTNIRDSKRDAPIGKSKLEVCMEDNITIFIIFSNSNHIQLQNIQVIIIITLSSTNL